MGQVIMAIICIILYLSTPCVAVATCIAVKKSNKKFMKTMLLVDLLLVVFIFVVTFGINTMQALGFVF